MGQTNAASLPRHVAAAEGGGWLGNVKAKIVAVTGVLLVVPALLNAGVDIYASAAKLPRSDAERQNIELFRKYFGKAPLVVNALPIRSAMGVVEVKFEVYEEGEIHVEYGNNSQWFRLPAPEKPTRYGLANFLPSAMAQGAPAMVAAPAGANVLRQSERLEGNTLTRSRELAGGDIERVQFDIRTGRIIGKERIRDPEFFRRESVTVPATRHLQELRLRGTESGG